MRRGYGPGGRNGRGRLAALVIAGLLVIIIVLLVILWQLLSRPSQTTEVTREQPSQQQ